MGFCLPRFLFVFPVLGEKKSFFFSGLRDFCGHDL